MYIILKLTSLTTWFRNVRLRLNLRPLSAVMLHFSSPTSVTTGTFGAVVWLMQVPFA